MFGNEAKGLTLVYEYGCGAPTANLADAQIEMCLRVQLWNRFVEIERDFRKKYDALLTTAIDPGIASVSAQVAELEKSVKDHKKDAAYTTIQLHSAYAATKEVHAGLVKLLAGQPFPEPKGKKKYKAIPGMIFADFQTYDEVRKTVTTLRGMLAPLYAESKAQRKELYIKNAAIIKVLEVARSASVKKARQQSGLFWGNYNDVIASYEAAHAASLKSKAQLHFKEADGTGKITVQFTTPLTVQQAFAQNGQFRLAPVPAEAYDPATPKSERGKLCASTVKIRIRSYPTKRDPVWLELPIYLHRPLPADCTLQSASIVFKKIGARFEYSLNITVRQAMPEDSNRDLPEASIRFGCRLLEDRSLYVATVSSAGMADENVVIPMWTTSRFEQVEGLRSTRDQYEVAAKKAILELRELKRTPKWFKVATEATHAWRVSERYFKLLKLWDTQRFAGDEETFKALAEFKERYDHLYPWEFNLRHQILRRRREQYRVLASKLVKRFDAIRLGEIQVGKGIDAFHRTKEDTNKQRWQNVASCSELRQIVLNTARREGLRVLDASGSPLFKTKKAARKALLALESDTSVAA